MCYHHINTFTASKEKWNTIEDIGKSIKNALYVLRYAKRHFLAEVTSNSEKIKPAVLAIIELRTLFLRIS